MKFRLREFFRTAPTQQQAQQTQQVGKRVGQHLSARALAAALIVGILLVPGTGFEKPAYAQEQTWKINVKNADLEEFVAQVAEITGTTIVVAPQLKGKVTVVSSACLLYTSPSPRDKRQSRMPSSA